MEDNIKMDDIIIRKKDVRSIELIRTMLNRRFLTP